MPYIRAATLWAALLFLGSLSLAPPSWAANNTGDKAATAVDAKQDQLKGLRERIDTLSRDLAKSEESKSDVADQLRDAEIAISAANRRLRELIDTHREVSKELADLDSQIKALDNSTASEQKQLARLLNRQFVSGDANALRLLLAGKDPNQAARDRYFLTKLSVAKAALTRELRAVAAQKRQLRERVQEREEKIRSIEAEQTAERGRLLKEQQQRQTLLAKIAGRINAQRKEIGGLRRDEERLGKLLDGLARIAAQNKAKAKLSRRDTAPAVAAKMSPGQTLRNNDPGKVAGAFGSLRGRLPLPVNGTIRGRFGSTRDDGSGVWKGMFIRASEGADVRAVAAGSIVFSDWLRGFGNLIIVDHGDDFLSIYAYNQSLLKAVGTAIKAGESIATAGNSGGHSESGLYFELRYQGQAFDPLKWIK